MSVSRQTSQPLFAISNETVSPPTRLHCCTLRSNSRALARISSSAIGGFPFGWSRHNCSMPACSFAMMTALVKLPDEHLLDPMHLGRHVGGGETGDLCDRRCVLLLEIEQHHLSIDRTQTMNQRVEPLESAVSIE